jgi:hypothetical protein
VNPLLGTVIGASSSSLRKLHNIIGSIVILDVLIEALDEFFGKKGKK